MEYQPERIERKWREQWEARKVYQISNESDKPKYYVLDMFPYPSGEGLHVGHPTGYVASDITARYKRLCGYNVLHPMGYDAFGLPAEQYAIQTGVHPAESTSRNIERYRAQLDNIGFSFDWSRQVSTCDPAYYRWTQQIFLWLFEHYYDQTQGKALPIATLVARLEQEGNGGVQAACSQKEVFTAAEWKGYGAKQQDDILMNYRLAYRKRGYVNWCEELGTVLANDEVKDGVSERGGYPVIQKEMWQWTLRITAYAERLLEGLEAVDFSEALKTQQRNWIGKSEGARVWFKIQGQDQEAGLEIFTTRPDTIFGATFMVLAPEHRLVAQITTAAQREAVDAYLHYVGSRTERERTTEAKRVTGAFTGAYAVHPFSGEAIPIWISEYVLVGYGTGAIMAVPSNDERDHRFASHFNLPIIPVIDQSMYPHAEIEDKVGKLQHSDFLNGMEVKEAIETVIQRLEAAGIGQRQINYRLRDANFSRQRYWGEPFPILYNADGVAVADTSLPLELPDLMDFKPTRDGQSPLARATHWHTQNNWTRELDTMPGYAGSSWYFLRYMDADNAHEPFSQAAVQYWQEVDLYVGGAEHAVGHLMYSRFWHKFLYDMGKVPTQEPYKKLINQGMIQGVIESLYLLKEKRGGKSVFVSADRLAEFGEQEDYAKISVYIGFVQEYGSEGSYLDAAGMEQFRQWRPDYRDAIFEVNGEGRLVTHSEVGKMSKRYFNVVNPDDVIAAYGADCFRMYEMFLGPIEDSKPWNVQGIVGVSKFLRKLWSLFYHAEGDCLVTDGEPTAKEYKILHTAIKQVRQGIESFSYNTCVSDFMKAVNELREVGCHKRAILQDLVVLIAPFAPHIAEELWVEALGKGFSIHQTAVYPVHEESYLKESEFVYPIQVGNKVRAKLAFSVEASKEEIERAIRASAQLSEWVDGKQVEKVIVVPKRLVNIVAK